MQQRLDTWVRGEVTLSCDVFSMTARGKR